MTFENYRSDIETCFATACNLCERACPVYQTNKIKTFTARGRNRTVLGLLLAQIKPSQKLAEVSYQCTACGSCDRWCALPNTGITRELRKYMVQQGFEHVKHRKNLANIQTVGNPYGLPDKYAWRREQQIEFVSEGRTLFFAGCTMPLRQPELLRKIIELLCMKYDSPQNNIIDMQSTQKRLLQQPLRAEFVIMDDEPCCGSYLFRTGYELEYRKLTDKLIDFIHLRNIREIITVCPGCFSAIRERMNTESIDVKVSHVVQLLYTMVQKSKLVLKRMKPELGNKFTYHDPCHLARLGGIFEEPRALLAQLGNIVEMKNNRYEADCCGSGGGVRAAYPELSTAICKRRIKAAQATGANLLVTACPFCEDRFMSVGGIEVKDIIELLYSAVIT